MDLWVSIGPNPCPEFFNDYGVATMTIGGLAIADAIEMMDTDNDFPEYHDYLLWDVNEDGVLDSVQFELLARILCLPESYVHPDLGPVKPVQDAFYANLAEFNAKLDKYIEKEDEIIAAAQPLLDVGNQILAVGGALLDDPITPEYNLPEVWNGSTLRDLADLMVYIGDSTLYHVNHGNIGPGGVIRQTFEGNVSTAHLAAAIMGLDSTLLDRALANWRYEDIEKGLALAALNWQHLLDLLQASGLDPVLVGDVENAIADSEVNIDDVPGDEDLGTFETGNGDDLLDPDTVWGDGGETLEELIDGLGGDPADVFDDIDDFYTVMPTVPDVSGMLLPAAEATITGDGFVVGDVTPMFDDVAPQGTVLDQNPLGGEYALAGSAIDLWVSAGPNPCPEFFDAWGVSTFTIGGRAIADAVAQADTNNDYPKYHDFDTWDVNGDGVLDSVQLELLARIMCLPDNYEHPVFGSVDAIKDDFYANLALYYEKLNKLLDVEDAVIAAAQPLKNVANQILAVGGALLDELITPEYNLPAVWDGYTLRELAQFMLDMGGHATWNLDQGNIGPGGLFRQTMENNLSTAHLVAALMSFDNSLLDEVFSDYRYVEVEKGLALADLNWQHLLDLLQSYGLDPGLVNDVETLLDDTTIVPEDIVEEEDLIVLETEDGDDLLDPDTEWGENGETLQDLIDSLGDDPETIFDDIEDLFTEMPMVPDVTGLLLPAAETNLVGAGFVVGDVTPLYDDVAPQGTVLDQNPLGGDYATTGSAVNLWVSAGPNPCPEFFDEWGNSTFTIGGRAIADGIQQGDTGGKFADYHDFDTWDFDEDGVADKFMYDMLAHVLCLPDTYEHPAIGPVKPIQDAFYANLDAVNVVLTKYWEKEDAIIAVGQPLKDVANQILAVGGALLDEPITPEYNLTPEWDGKTLGDLAEFMLDVGRGVVSNANDGNIGPGGIIHTVLEGNVSTAHLLAAVIGLDDSLGGDILGSGAYRYLQKAFALTDLNWQHLLDLLQASGLDPVLVNNVDTLLDDTEISLDDLDDDLYIFDGQDGNDLLDPNTEWGENGETLQDLLDGFGEDPDAIWDDIEDLFTEMPMVPDVTGLLLPAAESNLVGAGFVVGDVTPMFDDFAAPGTVLDQDPVGGDHAQAGTSVDLWVSAGPNPCPEFFDDYGNSTFTIGGRAIADAIAQADTGGDLTDYYDYDAWDFDDDGVADSVMFDLLAHIPVPAGYF